MEKERFVCVEEVVNIIMCVKGEGRRGAMK